MEAYRDPHGVPHVRTSSLEEAFHAQGRAVALDRGLQMEYVRRRALGRWAEVAGAGAVAGDLFARRAGAAAAAQRSFRALGDEARAVLTAYADGVNAVLPGVLSDCEELPGPVERWEPWHCYAVYLGRHIVMGSMAHKLFRTAMLPLAPVDLVWRIRPNAAEELLAVPPGTRGRYVDAGRPPADHGDVLRGWLNGLAAVQTVSASADPAAGSNNWVVSGARTASGLPLLAGDPHRPLETPGPYWQNHVSCDEFDVVGLSFPGVPGFPHFGHTEHVAWGITHGMADDQDLYIVDLDATTSRTETVLVRGGDPVEAVVHESPRGGVVMQDDTAGTGLALCWTGTFEPDRTLDCLVPMLRARSVEEFDHAMRGWSVPVDHLVTADTAGHIGYRLRGRVPVRHPANNWAAVPAWEPDYEWEGWVPFDDMPGARDPEEGILVSANNRPAAAPFIAHDFAGPARAARILELLREGGDKLDREAMERVHADVASHTARDFVGMLDQVEAAPDADPRAVALLGLLKEWDGAMGLGSVAATVYTEARRELLCMIPLPEAADSHGALITHEQRTGALWLAFQGLLAGVRDGDTSCFGPWPDAVNTALQRVVDRMTEEIGPDVGTWTWGQLHQARFTALLPNVPAMEGRPMPGDNETVRASGLHGVETTIASSGSVARYVFDVADWENSGWVVPEQVEEWYDARLVPMHYRWDVIEAVGERFSLEG